MLEKHAGFAAFSLTVTDSNSQLIQVFASSGSSLSGADPVSNCDRPHLSEFNISWLVSILSLQLLINGCGGAPKPILANSTQNSTGTNPTLTFSLSPATQTLVTDDQITFNPPFFAPLLWKVNGIPGGNAALGTVDSLGRYTAPSIPPATPVTVAASAYQNPGVPSASTIITVVNPIPAIACITPDGVQVDSLDSQIRLVGSGFNPLSQVLLDSQPLATTFVARGELRAQIPTSFLSTAGVRIVRVSNGLPGGGSSFAQFVVLNPQPAVATIFPTEVTVGSSDVQISIFGSGFVPSSHVALEGNPQQAIYVSSTELMTAVPDASLVKTAILSISISNDGPGGGTATTARISVVNPKPTIAKSFPIGLFVGNEPSKLTLYGDGFLPNSRVSINGQIVSSQAVNGDQLDIPLSHTAFSQTGPLSIVVTNDAPGGGSTELKIPVIRGEVTSTNNPLVARYVGQIPDSSKLRVEFGLQDSLLGTSTVTAPPGGGEASILIAGMKAASQYHVRPLVTMGDGTVIAGPDQAFITGPIDPLSIPSLVVQNNSLPKVGNGVELLDFVDGGSPSQFKMAVSDLEGNVIWYYQPEISNAYSVPIRQISNGNFLVSLTLPGGTSGISKVIREIDLSGETIREVTLDSINALLGLNLFAFHHDVIQLPNGHWIILAQEYRNYSDLVGLPGQTHVLGDVLIDVDKDSRPVWIWSTFDHLDVNRHPMQFPDWTHANALFFDEADGNLLMSMRHQSWIVKIDYRNGSGSGNILWRLGPGGDFSLAKGTQSQWFYAQHYPNIVSRDSTGYTLAIMDNGNGRLIDDNNDQCGPQTTPCYSRGILMHVDEQARIANLQWEFAPGFFSSWGGSASMLPNGDFEADFPQVPPNPSVGSGVYEVNQNGTIVWQMNMPNSRAYRAVRLPSLYPGVQW
ncbi:MAG: hypothetical protein C5B47_02685 [Verrucomicrobia bacterium]|nr:MAG: hypothetical protein C5B47_02685 [Verrucomicrobiota bacterium]